MYACICTQDRIFTLFHIMSCRLGVGMHESLNPKLDHKSSIIRVLNAYPGEPCLGSAQIPRDVLAARGAPPSDTRNPMDQFRDCQHYRGEVVG